LQPVPLESGFRNEKKFVSIGIRGVSCGLVLPNL
jgi:hypothetical protein